MWKGRWGVGSQRTFDEPCWECHKRFSLKFKQTDLSKKKFCSESSRLQAKCFFSLLQHHPASQIALLSLLDLYIYTTNKYPYVKELSWAINYTQPKQKRCGFNVRCKLKEIIHVCLPTASCSFFTLALSLLHHLKV